MTFEGGWLDPGHDRDLPGRQVRLGGDADRARPGKPVTISYTVSYSIGADSVNKDQAFVLLSYLAGTDGMTKWTAGRRGVAVARGRPDAGRQGRAGQGQRLCASPAPGFMVGYVDVQKAFQDAFTAQIQGKTYEAGPVVEATKAAIDKALEPHR